MQTRTSELPTIPLSEAAHRMGVSWERAWRLMLQRQLAGTKTNGRWYVTEESIAEYESNRAAHLGDSPAS